MRVAINLAQVENPALALLMRAGDGALGFSLDQALVEHHCGRGAARGVFGQASAGDVSSIHDGERVPVRVSSSPHASIRREQSQRAGFQGREATGKEVRTGRCDYDGDRDDDGAQAFALRREFLRGHRRRCPLSVKSCRLRVEERSGDSVRRDKA